MKEDKIYWVLYKDDKPVLTRDQFRRDTFRYDLLRLYASKEDAMGWGYEDIRPVRIVEVKNEPDSSV